MFKYKPMSHNLLLFLWLLSYGLRTLNTLPQETGTQDYRVSIYLQEKKNYKVYFFTFSDLHWIVKWFAWKPCPKDD